MFANLSQAPFGNNLAGPVRALSRVARVATIEPMRYPGCTPTGGAAPLAVPEGAVEAAAGHAPDVVVCLGGGIYVPPALRAALPPRAVYVGIALSDPQALTTSLAIAAHFDLFYTQDPQTLATYRRAGISARRCDLAVDAEEFRPLGAAKESDVVFVGKWTPYRDALVAALASRLAVRVFSYTGESRWSVPSGGPLATTAALCAELNRARLVLDPTLVEDGEAPFRGSARLTPRTFMAASCAVPALVEDSPWVAEFFAPGVELVTFAGIDDAVAKARTLVADGDACRAVGERARARVVACHTWDHRARGLLADVRGVIAGRPG